MCRGVILCPAREVATARALLSGTAKKFAILLIVLAKDFHDPPKDMTPQKVPGKVGVMLRSQDAYLQQACSKDQCAPQPVGISSAPQKIATKATAVLFVKVPKIFVDAQMWKQFIEKPQRQIAQWTAIHHVLCIDCFSWAEEQLQGGRRQVHGVIRVAQADVSTLLSHSGEQGIFLQLPRDKVSGQHVEWAERTIKNEPDAEYLTRVNRSRGDLGLVCRDNSLGWRRTNDPDSPVRKVWVLEHAPKPWDLQQVAALLQEFFTDINMFRQINRGAWKSFVFRAACKRGADVDLVPVTVLLDEPGHNSPVTLWAKIAPPRQVEYKQRSIKGGAAPFCAKTSHFEPVAVAQATQEDAKMTNADAAAAGAGSGTKKACTSKRPVPEGTILRTQPADGDCLFHTFSAGLHWLKRDKDGDPIHPHELRARAAAHIRRYEEKYKPQWEADGKRGPNNDVLDSWEDFLSAISKAGAFAGDLELRALCRIFDIRAVVVPEAPQFPVCAFHRRAAAKRVLATYHSQSHFDFLELSGKTYPQAILEVTTDPAGGFLVGGPSSHCTKFTGSASTSQHARSDCTVFTQDSDRHQQLGSKNLPRRHGSRSLSSACTVFTHDTQGGQAAGARGEVSRSLRARSSSLPPVPPSPRSSELRIGVKCALPAAQAACLSLKTTEDPVTSVLAAPSCKRRTAPTNTKIQQCKRAKAGPPTSKGDPGGRSRVSPPASFPVKSSGLGW